MNLFREMQKAYKDGRADRDPSQGNYWYQGELNFFDGHVIPLAKRIVEMGCFGVLGDEFLQNAEQNRREWLDKGCTIVEEMIILADADDLYDEHQSENDGGLQLEALSTGTREPITGS